MHDVAIASAAPEAGIFRAEPVSRVLEGYMTEKHRELQNRIRSKLTPQYLKSLLRDLGQGSIGHEGWKSLGDAGVIGLSVPSDMGGGGYGYMGSLLLAEHLAIHDEGGLILGTGVQSDVACQWLLGGPKPICDRFLPQLLSGQLVACQCDTDPSSSERMKAERCHEGIKLSGRKLYVINAEIADLCFVAADLDGKPSIILVETSRDGVSVEKVWDKLGTRNVGSASIRFEDVTVPSEHVLSSHGLRQMLHWNRVMSRLRFTIAIAATTVHGALLEHVSSYASNRELGGRALIAWPVNAHAFAAAQSDHLLMLGGVARCFSMMEKGNAAVSEIAQLKFFSVSHACNFASTACDLDGGLGYMAESKALAAYRLLRGFRMAGGSMTTMLTVTNHSLANRAETEAFEN